jgi:hypothetical protein
MEDWSRLADHVITARVRQGYKTRRGFAAYLDHIGHPVNERTLGNLERGMSVSADTVAAVEIGLGWEPGSGRAILAGGRPTLAAQMEDSAQAVDDLAVEKSPEIPPYIDLGKVEDWEREIWERLLLLSPHEKGLIIGVLKGVRGEAARAADVPIEHTTGRPTG